MQRAHIIAAGLLVALAACDPSGPRVGPPAEISLSSIPSGVQVGQTLSNLAATVRDADGNVVGGATVTWTVSHGSASPASSTTDGTGLATTSWTLGTTAGAQTITASAGGIETVRTALVEPGPLAQVLVTPTTVNFESVGDTAYLTADAADQYGNAVGSVILAWASSAPGVATVDAGRVVSKAPGAAVVSAAGGGMVGSADVKVVQVLAGLELAPASPVMLVGETLQLTVTPVDARGTAMDTTLAYTWETSNPGVATVANSGLVSGVANGVAVITARGAGRSAEVTVEVRAGNRPTITSISPAVLTAGDTATIQGTQFSATAASNQVTVAGLNAQVLSATAVQLRVLMPPAGVFPCGPTGNQPVAVTVDGLTAERDHPVAGATQRNLAVGQSLALSASQAACNELTSGGTYMVSVFSTSLLPSSTTPFRLRGSAPTVAADAVPAAPHHAHAHATGPAFPPGPAGNRVRPQPESAQHFRILEENARLARELSAVTTPRRRTTAEAFAIAAAPVGTSRAFRIPDLTSNNICTNFKTVTAKVVYSGDKAILWEDEAAPLAGQMNTRWQQIGQEYEQVMHPIILEYFGDPLAYDAFLANGGRVNMLFSNQINEPAWGVLGFVFSGDFFPGTACASSDEMALFYARVPTQPGSGYDGNTVDSWARTMRSTIIHEVKHIVSYATRLLMAAQSSSSPVYEASWLEESTARLAEEFFARALQGYTQGGNTSYQESVWCEARVLPGWPDCDPIPATMFKHFDAIYRYFSNVEGLSAIGPAVGSDNTFYGSGWLLVRWAMDHASMSESAFSKALVNEPQLTGVANLSARTGRSFHAMMADFTLAMAADDLPGVTLARKELTFPSWNVRDVLGGMNTDFPSAFTSAWPLAIRNQSFGDFEANVLGIRGGTAAIFRLTGPTGARQLLELLSSAGSAAPANLGLAIVRVN